MRIIFVTHFDPLPVGHGGFHRSYQIFRELEAIAGEGNVTLVKVWLQWWKRRVDPAAAKPMTARLKAKVERNSHRLTDPSLYARPMRRAGRFLVRRVESVVMAIGSYAENPLKLLAKTEYTTRSCSSPLFLSAYEKTLAQTRPALCVLEHTSFADLIPLNQKFGVPTVCCPQNLEAFDLMPLNGKWSLNSTAVDFANEIRVLGNCTERLFISRVETALVTGLGVPARYYPYIPVGEIRKEHLQIRAERSQTEQQAGLFVMLGSAEHDTTREGFNWFIEQVRAHGLPRGVRVVIAGSSTQKLLPDDKSVPGIQARGWVEQAELRHLLLHAQAMLIPQQRGFGALTRLPEFACADIPVIVSHHPTSALDLPPGARVAEDDWSEWCAQMEQVMAESPHITPAEYARWEERQPRTLNTVVGELAGL